LKKDEIASNSRSRVDVLALLQTLAARHRKAKVTWRYSLNWSCLSYSKMSCSRPGDGTQGVLNSLEELDHSGMFGLNGDDPYHFKRRKQ
jgi:hypothetical protein